MLEKINLPDFSNVNGNLEEIIMEWKPDFTSDEAIKNILLHAKERGRGFTNKIIKMISTRLTFYNIGDLKDILKDNNENKKESIDKTANEIALEILESNLLLAPKEFGTKYIRVYCNGVWNTEPDSFLEKIVLEHCIVNNYFDGFSDAQQSSRLTMVKRFVRAEVHCSIEDFDSNPYLINVLNGVIDISHHKFKFLEHSPDLKLIRQFPVKYDASIHCPNVLKFIREVFHREDIFLIYQWCGLCLTTLMQFQKGVLLYGEGSNGKDTFVNLLFMLIGLANISSVDLYDLDNSFLYSDTEGKTLNAVAETETNKTINIKKAKGHIGNTMKMQINRKNLAPYDITPTSKMMYAVNDHFPKLPEDVNKGFFRKWFIIECPNNFDKNPDNELLSKITSETELTGFLNLCLMALSRLLKKKKFTEDCKAITYWEDIKDAWLSKINFFSVFIEECCEKGMYESATVNKDNQYWELKDDVLNAYNTFRKTKGKPVVSPKTLTTQIKTNGFGVTKRNYQGSQKPIYSGFRLKEGLDKIDIDEVLFKKEKSGSLDELIAEANEEIHGKREIIDEDEARKMYGDIPDEF